MISPDSNKDMNFDATNVSIPFNMTIKSGTKLPPINVTKKLPTALSRAMELKKWN